MNTRLYRIRWILLLAVIGSLGWIITAPDPVHAGLNGQVKGRVTDLDGNPVKGAIVTLSGINNGVNRTAKTSKKGFYRFAVVNPGRYSLKVEKEGMALSEQKNFRISINQTAKIDFVMFPVAATE
jgi:uncharacterized membrane protein